MTTAIDYSFASPDPAAVKAAGISGVLVYTGPARPSAAQIADIRAHGLTVCLIQETDPNRSQQGFAAGVADAIYADGRADEVGYPTSCAVAYVVSDGSAGDPSSGAGRIAQYASGIASVSRRPRFYYGNTYACSAALQGDPHGLGTWIPSTWGQGTLLSQEANTPSPIADTDLNTVHAPYGAWGATGDDDVTPEQMATIGQWIKDLERRLEESIGADAHYSRNWIDQNGDPLLRDIQAKVKK